MASPGNRQSANCIGTLSFPILFEPTDLNFYAQVLATTVHNSPGD